MIRTVSVKLGRQQHGSAMIELSLVLPILILMLLGALDIGEVLVGSMIVADSAHSAAIGATQFYLAGDTSALVSNAFVSSGTFGGFPPHYNATAVVSCTCGAGGGTVSCTGTCAGNAMPAQYMTVTATATLPLFFGVTGLPANIPIKSVATFRTAWTGGQ